MSSSLVAGFSQQQQQDMDTTTLESVLASLALDEVDDPTEQEELQRQQQQQQQQAEQPIVDDNQHLYDPLAAPPSPALSSLSTCSVASSHNNNSNNASKPIKHFRFSYVTIRNYDITMGDNPAVSAGPPIQLDWLYEEIPPLPVNDFEDFKMARLGTRTSYIYGPSQENRVLTISPDFRTGILLRAGFSDWEIEQTVRNLKKIQQQRTRTALTFPFYRVEYAVRSAGRKLQRSMGNHHQHQDGHPSCGSNGNHNGYHGGGGGGGNHHNNKGRQGGRGQQQYPQHHDEMTTRSDFDEHSFYSGDGGGGGIALTSISHNDRI